MTPTLTLIGLACAIANNSPAAASDLQAQLGAEDQRRVQFILESDLCLPANMERLLAVTRERIDNGDLKLQDAVFQASPSESCL